ncbi:MAG: hypothetical protein B7Z37_24860 [Verrucomicrobia bacterium 12-59-8]|nr:MAG: hypothetical protein B7Z37_24860 [Verrucomicrobia bacterium 12-59-8]
MAGEIKKQILVFHDRLARDSHHRYRSWEHCFHHFRQRSTFTTPEHLDTASLHLAFYLASWGMYRGSSALLWKDYRIHQPAVAELLDSAYSSLWDLDLRDATDDSRIASLITLLSDGLRATYRQQITEVDGTPRDFQSSDTLITKILLGTLGCAPACDRYFILGFRHAGLTYSRFSKSFLIKVLRFYRTHATEFQETRDTIMQKGGISYPPMKLIDMYFWQLGCNLLPEAEIDET